MLSATLCLTYVRTSHTATAAAASVATTNIYCARKETYIYMKLPNQTAQYDVSNKDWPF